MSAETGTPPDAAAAPSVPLFPDVTRDDVFRLETRRLWLRWPRLADVAAMTAFAGLREVAEMTGTYPHPLPAGEIERRIFEARKGNATGNSLVLGLTLKEKPGWLIGSIGVAPPRRGAALLGEVEIGYMLHPEVWSQGLATEACHAVIDAVFRYTAATCISASSRVINPASRRVLERCGLSHAGSGMAEMPARGGMLPVDYFTLERKAWLSRRSWNEIDPAPASHSAQARAQIAEASCC